MWSLIIGWTENATMKSSFFVVLDKFARKEILNIVHNGISIYDLSKTLSFVNIERSKEDSPALADVHKQIDAV